MIYIGITKAFAKVFITALDKGMLLCYFKKVKVVLDTTFVTINNKKMYDNYVLWVSHVIDSSEQNIDMKDKNSLSIL